MRRLGRLPKKRVLFFAALLTAAVLVPLLLIDGALGAQTGTGIPQVGAPSGPDDRIFVKLDAGENVTCGVTKANNIRCWGALQNAPIRADGFIDVAVGESFACGIRTNGEVQCWGTNPGFVPDAENVLNPPTTMGLRSISRR